MQAGQVSQSPAEDLSGAVKPQAGVPGGGWVSGGSGDQCGQLLSLRLLRQHHLFHMKVLGGKETPDLVATLLLI